MNKKKTTKKASPKPVEVWPRVFETYRPVADYDVRQIAPSCFNGWVRVHRYRVTVERVEEPREVLIARLEELWAHVDNLHNWEPLRRAAAELGHTFTTSPGHGRDKEPKP